MCTGSHTCISEMLVCNGMTDCNEDEDETDCCK